MKHQLDTRRSHGVTPLIPIRENLQTVFGSQAVEVNRNEMICLLADCYARAEEADAL